MSVPEDAAVIREASGGTAGSLDAADSLSADAGGDGIADAPVIESASPDYPDGGASCDTVSGSFFIRYTIENIGSANLQTRSFYVDATWMPGGSQPTDWWAVHAAGQSCSGGPRADILLGGSIATPDGGYDVPPSATQWTIAGHTQPQSATDAVITLSEHDPGSSSTSNFWLASGGTVTGQFIATDCYEIVFTGVPVGPAAASSANEASGMFHDHGRLPGRGGVPMMRTVDCFGLLTATSIAILESGCDSTGTLAHANRDSGVDAAGASDAATPAPDASMTALPPEGGAPPVAQQWFSSDADPFQLHDPDLVLVPGSATYQVHAGAAKGLANHGPWGNGGHNHHVDPSVMYQTILGTGISMEEGSVWNLLQMSQKKRTEVLTELVDPVNGMGLNLYRVTMGTSDFTARDWYSYDDLPAGQRDPTLASFSIQKDIDFGIVATLREMLAINPKLKLFASMWSPPAWMNFGDNAESFGGIPARQRHSHPREVLPPLH